jgi:hypothetical protein
LIVVVRDNTQSSALTGFGYVVARNGCGMLLDDDACGVPQFVDVGSAHAECQQTILVSHEDRQGISQWHGVKFQVSCSGH